MTRAAGHYDRDKSGVIDAKEFALLEYLAINSGKVLTREKISEQKRFEVGMSTSFLVIQAQRDLAVARNNELQALLDYQLASVAFETAQRVGR